MNIEQISIKKFDIKQMQIDSKVLLLSKPRYGKSTLIKDILYQHRKKFTAALCFSASEEANSFYSGIIPDVFIYPKYEVDVVERLRSRQQKLLKKNGKEHPDNPAVIVADDCMDSKDWTKSDTTKWLFKNGRHYDVFFLLASQYAMDIGPELRTSVDYVFILKQTILKDKRRIYENFAGVFPNFQMFCDVLDNLTEDYHCMVLNNRSTSGKIEDTVFWYKADLHNQPFRVGTPGLWKYHDRYYNQLYEKEEQEERERQLEKRKYDAATRRKNAPLFVVNKIS